MKKTELILTDPNYKAWLVELKQRVRQSQLKAVIKVNTQLLELYWQLGADIVEKQKSAVWGDKFLAQLSQDLMIEFPQMKGFSKRNLEHIRRWYLFWSVDNTIAKQAVSQLTLIPWGHNIQILTKCQSIEEAVYYLQNTLEHGWSRNVLVHQIESALWQREGKALNNFSRTLPALQSDLARQTLKDRYIKDPYIFDFLSLSKEHTERELEQGLVENITQFLLALGAGFAYMGKQYPLRVGERDFYIDLLFYHARLHCYVVIELKLGTSLKTKREPEYAGKLNFYINAIDKELCKDGDAPTIGILLCKSKDKLVAEYALNGINNPMGVSQYQLTQALPDDLQGSLPSIAQLEQLEAEHE